MSGPTIHASPSLAEWARAALRTLSGVTAGSSVVTLPSVRELRGDGLGAGPPRAVVIGNFDGVHRGHQHVLEQARARARRDGLTASVLTFRPHPSAVLGRAAPPRLTSFERRVELLAAAGAEAIVIQLFDEALAGWSPERFAHEFLVDALAAKVVIVGENFRFGERRAGDFAALVALGARYGFEAQAARLLEDERGPISSSRIRRAIADGDVTDAAALLGRLHTFSGVVVLGDQRGRTMGFPTANLDGVDALPPRDGVYAVLVECTDVAMGPWAGVMNIGARPTIAGEKRRTREVHLLDVSGDFYGARLSVAFVARLRDERRFAGLDDLRAQIAADVVAARGLLAAISPSKENPTAARSG